MFTNEWSENMNNLYYLFFVLLEIILGIMILYIITKTMMGKFKITVSRISAVFVMIIAGVLNYQVVFDIPNFISGNTKTIEGYATSSSHALIIKGKDYSTAKNYKSGKYKLEYLPHSRYVLKVYSKK